MKKTLTKLALLTLTAVMVLTLVSCGNLLNGTKKLKSENLVPTSYGGSGGYGVNSSQATLTLKMYKLTTASNTTTIWITFTPFTSRYGYLFPLRKNSTYSYSVKGDSNSSTNSAKISLGSSSSDPEKGYKSFSLSSLDDAYIVIQESSSGYSVDAFSNIVTRNDIIQFSAANYTTSDILNKFTDYIYSSVSSASLVSQPYPNSSVKGSTYRYLWVNLDNKVWVNLGNVYN